MGGEDDGDDYSFGDFTFASFPSSSTVHSQHYPQINGPSLTSIPAHTSSSNDDFGDDWSDFVKSPIQSDDQARNAAPANTQSKSFDPFGFFPQNNNGDANLSGSTQKGEPESTQIKKKGDWEKPKGPLPLSLFGDVEEEEEKVEEEKRSSVNDPLGGYGKDSSSRKVQNGSNNVSSNVGFNDVIVNLYNYNNNQQIKAEQNGFFPNQNSSNLDTKGVNLNEKDSILGLSELNLSSASVDVKKVLDNNDQTVKNEDKFKLNSNGSVSNLNADALGLDSSGWSLNFSRSNSILNDQSEQNKGGNIGSNMSRLGPSQNALGSNLSASNPAFGGRSLDFGGFSSSSNTFDANLNASNSNFNGFSSNRRNEELDASGEDNEYNDDDDGWEFQGAVSEAKVTEGVDKADPETLKISDINTQSSGFGGGSNGSIDLFALSDGSVDLFSMSNGVSSDSGRVGTENVKPTTAPENSFNLDKSYKIEQTGVKSGLDSHPLVRAPENDEDFEEFTAAFCETGPKKEGELKANDIFVVEIEVTASGSREQVNGAAKVHDVSQLNAYSPSYGNQSSRPVDLFALSNESIDFFGMSNGVSSASLKFGTGFDTMPSTAAQSGFISTTPMNKEPVDIKDRLDPHPVPEGGENDEDFGEFTAAFPEAAERQQEGKFPSDRPTSDLRETTSDGKDQRIEMNDNKRGALPLSIFGDQELEVDDTLNSQNTFLHSPSPVQRNGLSPAKVISVDDIISNLYSRAEQNSSVDTLNGTTDIEVRPAKGVNSDLLKDDFDGGSWEFKDAFVAAGAENEKSHGSPEDAYWSSPSVMDAYESSQTNGRLDDYIEFYSKLKDGLSFVMKFHLENLKEARNTATLSGKDDNVMALDEEIQEVYKLLDRETVILQEDRSEGHLTGDSCLKKFLEALQQQKFQILESEYGLSRRLLLAEKDLQSAVELRKHAMTMLKILSFGSSKDHLMYISIWSKMISVCVQELQSGANIWKQSLRRNVQNELVAEPEGKKFVQALGEIYRAAMVLGASAELYKPWTLENSAGSANIFALIDECNSVWSASGLGEALSDMLHSSSFGDNSGFAALVESIQYICDLDLLALQDHAFTQQQSRCQLSLLTSETIPGMKVVAWDGEQYFVKLANLWANLISSDPPRVPHLHASANENVG